MEKSVRIWEVQFGGCIDSTTVIANNAKDALKKACHGYGHQLHDVSKVELVAEAQNAK